MHHQQDLCARPVNADKVVSYIRMDGRGYVCSRCDQDTGTYLPCIGAVNLADGKLVKAITMHDDRPDLIACENENT